MDSKLEFVDHAVSTVSSRALSPYCDTQMRKVPHVLQSTSQHVNLKAARPADIRGCPAFRTPRFRDKLSKVEDGQHSAHPHHLLAANLRQ
ncbi:hypothetical protein KC322_g32 [Hortaea werneckii]|nr:hypothetical protein KC322_g32 [Hortaea werneckii]